MMLTYECFICGSFLSDILSPAFQLVVNVKEMEASQPRSGSLSGFAPSVPYNCSISASTAADNGLPASAVITTTEICEPAYQSQLRTNLWLAMH